MKLRERFLASTGISSSPIHWYLDAVSILHNLMHIKIACQQFLLYACMPSHNIMFILISCCLHNKQCINCLLLFRKTLTSQSVVGYKSINTNIYTKQQTFSSTAKILMNSHYLMASSAPSKDCNSKQQTLQQVAEPLFVYYFQR